MKKILHMIGNSHIDPVWFWTREEGMQEVCATLSSALDRMEEYPDFKYTCTSAAFFAFIEEARPELLDRIRAQVRAGRFELTGGWWIEPDCCLPCGESLVRQGLYGQRTFLRLFGRLCAIGSNVDSFGHSPALPQILRGCRLTRYVFMRPSLTRATRPYMEHPVPLIDWVAPDGSSVAAFSLPAEYTCWFEETLRKNIDDTLSAMGDQPAMACFYGVGNHGGGPTKANIEAIGKLAPEYPDIEFRFSTLTDFFAQADKGKRPPLTAYLEHINTGCYSVDHRYKQMIRRAERNLLRAERLNALACLNGLPGAEAKEFAALWQRLLFCQFHDTLGGTEVLEARDNAMRDVGGVSAQAEYLSQLAVQRLASAVDTRGEGHPLLLINDTDVPFDGVVDTEFYWFCKDDLTILDEGGREVPYQRLKQSCTMKWYHLGGRRRAVFRARVPAFGCALYRACSRPPSLLSALPDTEETTLENERIRVAFDDQGRICSLLDKESGLEALTAPVSLCPWVDNGDSWGNHGEDGQLDPLEPLRFLPPERVETGTVRNTVRLTWQGEAGRIRILAHLDQGERFLRLEMWVLWQAPWRRLKMDLPVGCVRTAAEGPMCQLSRLASGEEAYMHRYVDALREDGSGLLCVNDGVYAFDAGTDGCLSMTLLRSAIYAHGNALNWHSDKDSYDHADMGEHRYTFLLAPHGKPLDAQERLKLADRLSAPPIALPDMIHQGRGGIAPLLIRGEGIHLEALKPGEDGGVAVRLREVNGSKAAGGVAFDGMEAPLQLNPYQIKTLIFRRGQWRETDMLEMTE